MREGLHMLHHYTNTASFFSVLMAMLIFSLSLARVAVAQNNTRLGTGTLLNNTGSDNTAIGSAALYSNTTGDSNTATGGDGLFSNTTGDYNTANGVVALYSNTTGSNNSAIGSIALFWNTT